MSSTAPMAGIEKLASYQCCIQRIRTSWPLFLEKREQRLKQQNRNGGIASEKVAENIIEDLFTQVLDWEIADIYQQLADVLEQIR